MFDTRSDDFYITSRNLVVQETTNDNYNPNRYRGVNPKAIVFEFIRNTVANRLAKSGGEWANIFGRKNGGTYNNQFMIVDYNRFRPGHIDHGFLTVLEQMPEMLVSQDQTPTLLVHSYWASYNVPFYREIYQSSGFAEQQRKYGDHFSHEKTERALIFKRDQGSVRNMTTLYRLMRSNDFKHDPLSRCNCTPPYSGIAAIAARADLSDPNGTYPNHDYTFRSMGAIDTKMTNSSMARRMEFVAQSGPTNQNVPTFSWATTKLTGIRHRDQPTEWNFRPVITGWNQTAGGQEESFAEFKFNF